MSRARREDPLRSNSVRRCGSFLRGYAPYTPVEIIKVNQPEKGIYIRRDIITRETDLDKQFLMKNPRYLRGFLNRDLFLNLRCKEELDAHLFDLVKELFNFINMRVFIHKDVLEDFLRRIVSHF